jgi:uncharacterized RDD family membrane protein YckC
VERRVDIDTGESVAFSFELAGLGSRFLAVAVDIALQLGIALLVLLLVVLLTVVPAFAPLHVSTQLAKIGGGVFLAIGIIAFFALFFGYFILFECVWQGKTPGKRLIGIRVVRDGGFPLDFISSVIRNVVRILELAFGFYTIAAVSTLLSTQNKRLGDFAAGTIVVRDGSVERYETPREKDTEDPVVRELCAQERELIRRYVARCESLMPRARENLAASIARRIRPRLGANFNYLADEELLMHLMRTAL